MDSYTDLIKLILPEFLVDHFDLTRTTKADEKMHLYFEERNIVPEEAKGRILIAHGFLNEITPDGTSRWQWNNSARTTRSTCTRFAITFTSAF